MIVYLSLLLGSRGSVYIIGSTSRLGVLYLDHKINICEKNQVDERDVREIFFYVLSVKNCFVAGKATLQVLAASAGFS